MTAGNNGSGTPEDDDPFAYLYRSEGAEGGGQPGAAGAGPRAGGYGYPGPQQPGVPRTSYHHVRAVGERSYGQQQAYGQQQPAQSAHGQQAYGQQGYDEPTAHYAAPETYSGGPRQQPPPYDPPYDGGRGRGPNSKGLLIGAIAVVLVVLVGIGIAMINNGGGNGGSDDKDTTSQSGKTRHHGGGQQKTAAKLPKEDAASLRLDGGTYTAHQFAGAQGHGGTYVAGINHAGASATWNVNVNKPNTYRFYVRYGVPGQDEGLSLTVNGKKASEPINMKNYAGAKQGDWAHGWATTWALVSLNQGQNTLTMSCDNGDKCDVNLDQVWLAHTKPGDVS